MGTVLTLAGGLGLTVLGLGSADQAVASFDAASWVWSRTKGEMARINGVTAKVDTRVDVPRAREHQLEVSQSDRFVILRDVTTGAIGTMDLTSLQTYWTRTSSAGLGVRVALKDNTAFVIDTVQGEVQQLDPGTLGPVGQLLHFSPGITGGVFDGKGRLWIASPSEGTVTSITPVALPSGSAGAGAGGSAAAPRLVTKAVAEPNHDLTISTLNDGVAVLNRTTDALTTIHDDQDKTVTLPLTGPGALPTQTDGRSVPVTVADTRHVYVVNDATGARSDFAVPGSGSDLEPAVAWRGYFYVADAATGAVHVFDSSGTPQTSIGFADPGGPLELEVREGYLFINAPGSSTARVVDDNHTVHVVDKYANDVLGGDRPPVPPAPPKPPKPVVARPGAPRNVRAAAGNTQATVTWQAAAANGAPITRYVVDGAGRTFQVGAGQRSLTVTGLTNGETYQFAVHAVNRKGDGPARSSNPVRPTAEVPDAPTAIKAEARPDGTVVVSWPAANGQGLAIKRYTVTAIAEGGSAPIGDTSGTSLTVADGKLQYGTQYAFTVVAINERGAGSKPSPVSASVVPFTKPGKPLGLAAATVADQAGAIKIAWQAPPDNGRAISKYVVTAAGQTQEVTDGTAVTVTGLGNGQSVQVQVKAVNEAGAGEPAVKTAQTVAAPKVTITGGSTTFNSATVTVNVDAGGGSPTCTLTANGKTSNGTCESLRATGLKSSGSKYTLTVTARNVAGSASAQRTLTTSDLYGNATCIDNKDSSDPAQRVYCDEDRAGRNGNEIFAKPDQASTQVGWVKTGSSEAHLLVYCKKSGDNVDPYVYNKHSASSWWLQIDYKGTSYIPYAWLYLEQGDDIDAVATC